MKPSEIIQERWGREGIQGGNSGITLYREGRGKEGASTCNRKTRSEMWEGKLHVPCLEKSREKHIPKRVISGIRLWRGVRGRVDLLAQPVRRLEISEGPISLEWWQQALGC